VSSDVVRRAHHVRFSKNAQTSDFVKSVQWELNYSMWTNRWLYMTELRVAFHSFENRPKTHTHTLLVASKNDLRRKCAEN